MCRPKVKAPEPDNSRPDVLVSARDGQPINSSAQARKRTGMRLDLNSPAMYQGLTIPRGF